MPLDPTPAAGDAEEGLPEVSTLPRGTHGQVQDGTTGTWQRVPAPRSVTDPTPVEEAGSHDAPPPVPTLVKVVGGVAVAALLSVAIWLGMTLGTSPAAAPSPSPTASPSPSWALAAPQVVGDWVQGQTSSTQPLTEGGPAVVRSDYSDGKQRISVILSRPEADPRAYLVNAGIKPDAKAADPRCGTQSDTHVPVCAEVVDGTGIMVVGLSNQAPEALAKQLDLFHKTLAGN